MLLFRNTSCEQCHDFFKFCQRFNVEPQFNRCSVTRRVVEGSWGATVEFLQFSNASCYFCVRCCGDITEESGVSFFLCFRPGCFIGWFISNPVGRKKHRQNTAQPAELNTDACKSSGEYEQKIHKVISTPIECFSHHFEVITVGCLENQVNRSIPARIKARVMR